MANLLPDKKDTAILQQLDLNVRASCNQIGKKTRLSKEVVQYRIKQLEKNQVITGYWSVPSIKNNTSVYKLLIKNKSLGIVQRKEFIAFITSQKATSWAATTEGQWDFVITSFVQKETDFYEFLNKLLLRFGKYFSEKNILRSVSAIILNEKYLHPDNKHIIKQENNFLNEEKEKDDVDSEIIKALSENSRSTFTEIGKKVGLTSEAISYRYKQIMKKKLITSMKVRINHEKLGLNYYHLFLSLNDYKGKNEIKNYYIMHPNCVFIMEHMGFYDLHLELVVSENDVQKIIEDLSERFGNEISRYELIKIRKEHIINVMR
ncbi:Lrp/AsnC family transcriptional regulator [Candidatus Woesearchaeota archaeon]|nr:Lrp/AsnC family transcriptional regulator [Candidatus Woesearchaeota archaeon]